MTTMTRTASILCVALLLSARPSAAQTSAESKAAAEALFDEGRKLLDAGQIAPACEKLEQSDRLDPAVGTQLNLAVCYERAGRTASAWATYRRAAALASSRGQAEREQLARDGAAALESKLSRLSIVVPAEARVDGLEIERNGERVAPEVWGQAMPVDPGTVRVEARAPGREPWRSSIEIRESGKTESISVPVLTAGASAPAAQPTAPIEPTSVTLAPESPPPDAGDTGSSQRTWGLVVGGAGVVGLAVGGFFALRAASKNDDSKEQCLPDNPNLCSPEGAELRDEARSAGNVATIASGLGLALAATGAVLYFTAPSDRASVGVRGAPGGAELVLGGRF
jgi:serine/threonine-protein kinase